MPPPQTLSFGEKFLWSPLDRSDDGLDFLVPAVHSVDLPERGSYSRVMVSIKLESHSAKSCKHSKIVLFFSRFYGNRVE